MTDERCTETTKVNGFNIRCDLSTGHHPGSPHYSASEARSWGAADGGCGTYHPETGLWDYYEDPAERSSGTITVKLVLDTTDFDAAVERVKAALAELVATPIKVEVR